MMRSLCFSRTKIPCENSHRKCSPFTISNFVHCPNSLQWPCFVLPRNGHNGLFVLCACVPFLQRAQNIWHCIMWTQNNRFVVAFSNSWINNKWLNEVGNLSLKKKIVEKKEDEIVWKWIEVKGKWGKTIIVWNWSDHFNNRQLATFYNYPSPTPNKWWSQKCIASTFNSLVRSFEYMHINITENHILFLCGIRYRGCWPNSTMNDFIFILILNVSVECQCLCFFFCCWEFFWLCLVKWKRIPLVGSCAIAVEWCHWTNVDDR